MVLLINELQDSIVNSVEVSDAEIEKYYNENKDRFTVEEQVVGPAISWWKMKKPQRRY